MSVLVLTESIEGKFKKASFEVVSYGKKIASLLNTTLTAIAINTENAKELHKYGAEKIIEIKNDSLKTFNAKTYTKVVKQVAEKENASVIIITSDINGLYIAPMIAVELNAGYASNVVALPSSTEPFTVKRKVFSNKAFSNTTITSKVKVLTLSKNSFGIVEEEISGTVEEVTPNIEQDTLISKEIEQTKGKVSIADAEIVVSGGRGLKGPENWGMIEELAEVLNAATACSKPVSDLGWRSHNEHVGQTGKPVSSNLYIAIGISGAIQHLAGVNSSKVKVVINTDAEAPFFKAADYGIVGDAFEVVPELIKKLKEFKAKNA